MTRKVKMITAIAVLCLCAVATYFYVVTNESETTFCFQTMELSDNGLEVTFGESTGRYLYDINGGESKLTNYGEKISIPYGSSLFLRERHESYLFSPLPRVLGVDGYIVKHTFDARSFGDGVEKGYAIVVRAKDSDMKVFGIGKREPEPPRHRR